MPVTYKPTNVVISPFIRYSGTSAYIESDFSIVKWETDGARTQMEHYSLEEIMQCKEHERLKAVVFRRKLNK